jgi:hypothetical protein
MATFEQKKRAMDALAHRETQKHLRTFRGKNLAPSPATPPVAAPSPLPQRAKRLVMDAISNVETVTQVGAIKVAGGIAVYAARIREMDRQNQRKATARQPHRGHLEQRNDFLRD